MRLITQYWTMLRLWWQYRCLQTGGRSGLSPRFWSRMAAGGRRAKLIALSHLNRRGMMLLSVENGGVIPIRPTGACPQALPSTSAPTRHGQPDTSTGPG